MEVSREFRSSLIEHGTGRVLDSADSERPLHFRCRDAQNVPRLSGSRDRLHFGEDRLPVDEDAPELLADANEAVFVNLLRELQRYCSVSSVDTFDGELMIDLLSSAATDEVRVSRTCEVIQAMANQSKGFACEYQLTIWAVSPVRAALVDAAVKAAELQARVEEVLTARSLDSVRLSSSGQIWSSGIAIRPAVTIVIRRIGPKRISQISLEPNTQRQ